MFRAAATGPYDEAVAKATDENLTSEDWAAILEVCDKVGGDANGPKEVVQSLIRRLAHRNANVQLYALELGHALCQNCGKPVHREVSSRAFTEALLRLANDRNTHAQVKAKILEKMQEWSDMFSRDPDLGIMYDAYFRLKQSNPTLQPPSAPQKQGLTDADRQKEEDELQMALQLSLQEEERKKPPPAVAGPSGQQNQSQPQQQQQQQQGQQQQASPAPAAAPGTTAATVSRVRALYDFVPSEPGELEFKRGDVIAVLESVYKDWWRGSLKGKTGIFPLNYVEKLTDPTPDELQREAQMEAEVFAEIKNVEKLLTLLSASNTAPREEDNEEISKLYHQTLAIRPKLIKLIEKYSQKKDDFTQLNEKFIKARRDYEALLESSMSHPPHQNYPPYGIRPAGAPPPGQGYPQQQGYPVGYGGPQDAQQRYYTPGPQGQAGDRPYPASPPTNYASQTPAPFYVAGAEVPSQYPPRDDHQQQPPQQHPPASSPSPQQQPPQQFVPYSQPVAAAPPAASPPPAGINRVPVPVNNYSGAQELATSVYDSPIAPNPHGGLHSPPAGAGGAPAPQPTWQASAPVYAQQPASSPPPIPTDQPPQVPQEGMVPLPLRPGGPQQQQQHEPSAPSPNDYYRSGVY